MTKGLNLMLNCMKKILSILHIENIMKRIRKTNKAQTNIFRLKEEQIFVFVSLVLPIHSNYLSMMFLDRCLNKHNVQLCTFQKKIYPKKGLNISSLRNSYLDY